MRKKFGAIWAVGAMVWLGAPSLYATTATSMSSFEGEEEPTDIVHSDGSITTGDSFDNMTSPSSGVFRFYLRFSSSQWDGDRSTGNTDRQRAEVKGLGTHQKNGETFDYSETWKTNRGGSGSFWHVFQLKATDGDNGAPIVVNSIQSGTNAAVRYWPGSSAIVARSYSFSLNTYTNLVMRIKTSTSANGEVRASINGDGFSGATGVVVSRSGTTDYRPKWGSYRGVSSSSPYGNDTIEHTNVTANKVTSGSTPTPTPRPTATPTPTPTPGGSPTATPTPTPTPGGGGSVTFEAESVTYTNSGTGATLQNDANTSGGHWVSLDAENTGSWLEFTSPTIPAGTYTLSMSYKTNDNRGQLSLKVDGTQVGSTLDQYHALPSTYPTATFGTVSFGSSGSHKIRLTVTGKNSASSNFVLSADKFTLQ
jgi:hypothetical protein